MNRFSYGNGNFLNFETYGHGKKVMIFLHGFAASLRNWDDVFQHLPEDEVTAYRFDLKGAGKSSKPRDAQYRIQDNARILFQFIKQHDIQDYVLVGHSYGGGVALFIAVESQRERRNAPAKLILIDAAAYKTELPFFVSYLRTPVLSSILLNVTSAEFKARYTLERLMFDKKKVTSDLVRRYASQLQGQDTFYALRQTAVQVIPDNFHEFTEKYKTLRTRTLVIWGEQDPAIPVASGRRLATDLPRATLVVFPQCGHNPHEEHPADVARTILEFVTVERN